MSAFAPFLFVLTVSLLLFEGGPIRKELCDLYRYFQTSYFNELEAHKTLKGQMAVKEQELKVALDEVKAAQDAEKKADETLTKALADHSLVLANKDDEIRLLRKSKLLMLSTGKTRPLGNTKSLWTSYLVWPIGTTAVGQRR